MPAWAWKVVYDGKTPPQGQVVRPNERLITNDFQIAGIALGTLMVIVYFHLVRFLRDRMGTYDEPSDRQPAAEGAGGEPTGREVGDREP